MPLGTKTAASLPSRSADTVSRRFTVGSSPKTSSPTSAVAIACRMASLGFVTVSLRKSIVVVTPVAAPKVFDSGPHR